MVQLEVWGKYALFSRPELSVERVSYDVITPSAARGIIEAIYWHPGLKYKVNKIYVLNPIKFASVRRNEVKNKALASDARRAMMGQGKDISVAAAPQIVQRSSLLLQDVHYVIEAEFSMTKNAAPSDSPAKFASILNRRMEKGQCYHTPCFGCREFTANFRPWTGGPIPTIDETRDLGLMAYDFDYKDPSNPVAMFFRARMEHGMIDIKNSEVYR